MRPTTSTVKQLERSSAYVNHNRSVLVIPIAVPTLIHLHISVGVFDRHCK